MLRLRELFTTIATGAVLLAACSTAQEARGAMVTLKPDAAVGKDTWIWANEPAQAGINHGGEIELRAGDINFADQLILIEFTELATAVPVGSVITSAFLRLYLFDHEPFDIDLTLGAYEILQDWDENTVTGATKPSDSGAAEDSQTISTVDTWYEWDITLMVQQWVTAPATNFGTMVYDTNPADEFKSSLSFASSDVNGTNPDLIKGHPGAEFTPELVVTFEPGEPAVIPEPASLAIWSLGAVGIGLGALRRRWSRR